MPVNNPRTRLINFRISEEEFASLRHACQEEGARSLSDYARAAVLGAHGPAGAAMENRLQDMAESVRRLESTVRQVMTLLERLTPVAAPGGKPNGLLQPGSMHAHPGGGF